MRNSSCLFVLVAASICRGDGAIPRTEKPQSRSEAVATSATPVERIKVAAGFQVERLYSVPKDRFGTWINLAVDPKGRLITSDESGSLYRVTVPKKGQPGDVQVERLPVDIGPAQGSSTWVLIPASSSSTARPQ